jgi:hypothetical protein
MCQKSFSRIDSKNRHKINVHGEASSSKTESSLGYKFIFLKFEKTGPNQWKDSKSLGGRIIIDEVQGQ